MSNVEQRTDGPAHTVDQRNRGIIEGNSRLQCRHRHFHSGFLILAILTRYVSLGSCWAGASFPFATWFVYHNVVITVLGAVIGLLILYMHRGNIKRLLTGTENKFSLHKKK